MFLRCFSQGKAEKHDTELAKSLEAFHQALHITALADSNRTKTAEFTKVGEFSHNKQVM